MRQEQVLDVLDLEQVLFPTAALQSVSSAHSLSMVLSVHVVLSTLTAKPLSHVQDWLEQTELETA